MHNMTLGHPMWQDKELSGPVSQQTQSFNVSKSKILLLLTTTETTITGTSLVMAVGHTED